MEPDEPVDTAAETRRLAQQLRIAQQLLVAERRRPPGPEIDYGSIWTSPDRPGVWHRLSWNTGSHELTLTRRDTGERELLGHYPTRTAVDAAVDGWATQASTPDGIGWVRSQLARHPSTTIARAGQQRFAGMPSDRQTRFARLADRQDRRELDRHSRPDEPFRGRER